MKDVIIEAYTGQKGEYMKKKKTIYRWLAAVLLLTLGIFGIVQSGDYSFMAAETELLKVSVVEPDKLVDGKDSKTNIPEKSELGDHLKANTRGKVETGDHSEDVALEKGGTEDYLKENTSGEEGTGDYLEGDTSEEGGMRDYPEEETFGEGGTGDHSEGENFGEAGTEDYSKADISEKPGAEEYLEPNAPGKPGSMGQAETDISGKQGDREYWETDTEDETEEPKNTENADNDLPEKQPQDIGKDEKPFGDEEPATEMEVGTEQGMQSVLTIETENPENNMKTDKSTENQEVILIDGESQQTKRLYGNSTEQRSSPMGFPILRYQNGQNWPEGYEHYFNGNAQSSERIGFNGDVYKDYFTLEYSVTLKDENNKGKIGVRYNKIGKYQGKDIDMKVLVTDWGYTKRMVVTGTYVSIASFENGQNIAPNVAFSKKRPRFFVTGTDYIDFQFQFFESGTETPIAVKGHSTAVDIDTKQGVKFLSGIDSAYVAADSDLLIDENNKVYTDTVPNTTSTNQKRWVAFNFSSQNHKARFYCGYYWDRLNHSNATEDYGYASSFDIIEFKPEVFCEIEKECSVTVKKTDAETGNSLTGAVFTLDQWSMAGNKYISVGNLTDRGDGSYILDRLAYTDDNQGMFKVRELQAPPGHTSEGWSQEFTMDGFEQGHMFSYEVTNPPIKTRIEILKKDRDTGTVLAGAVYSVYSDKECKNKVMDTGRTGNDGRGITPEFVKRQQSYYVKETAAPEGYFLDDTVFTVQVPDNDTVQVERTDQKALGKIAVAKKADRTTGASLNKISGRYEGTKNSGSYGPGERITFSIRVTNTGNIAVRNIRVSEMLNDELKSIVKEGSAVYEAPKDGKTENGLSIQGTISQEDPFVLNLDILEPGDGVNLLFSCQVADNLNKMPESCINQVTVTGQYEVPNGGGLAEIVPDEDDSDTDRVCVVFPSIAVTKLADRTKGVTMVDGTYQGERENGCYSFSENVDYEIRVKNTGTVPVMDLLVEERLSEELQEVVEPGSIFYKNIEELKSEKGTLVKADTVKDRPLCLILDKLEPEDSVTLHLVLKIIDKGERNFVGLPNVAAVTGIYQIPGTEKTPDIPKDEDDEDEEKIDIQGGKILLHKESSIDKEALSGAVFEIRTLEEKVISTLVTDKQGIAESKYLPFGGYKIVEVEAPEGYELMNTFLSVELTEQNILIEHTVENEKAPIETEPPSSEPAETEPETLPVKTEPETLPVGTEPGTLPAETEPFTPKETEKESSSTETEPGTLPSETEPTSSQGMKPEPPHQKDTEHETKKTVWTKDPGVNPPKDPETDVIGTPAPQSTGAQPVSTGDETNLIPLAVTLIFAAVLLIFGIVWRLGRKKV